MSMDSVGTVHRPSREFPVDIVYWFNGPLSTYSVDTIHLFALQYSTKSMGIVQWIHGYTTDGQSSSCWSYWIKFTVYLEWETMKTLVQHKNTYIILNRLNPALI